MLLSLLIATAWQYREVIRMLGSLVAAVSVIFFIRTDAFVVCFHLLLFQLFDLRNASSEQVLHANISKVRLSLVCTHAHMHAHPHSVHDLTVRPMGALASLTNLFTVVHSTNITRS